MIVRLPDVPPMTEDGDPPDPLAVLLGSAGPWQPRIAKDLGAKAGSAGAVVMTDCPIRGVLQTEGYRPEPILDAIQLLVEAADVVMVWIDGGPVWLWLELGVWIADRRFVWGIDESVRSHFHHVGHLYHLLVREGRAVRATREDTLIEAGIRLQERRAWRRDTSGSTSAS